LAGKLPKAVSPEAHAIIDWVTFGTFFTAGALLWNKNKRASLAAYLCADIVGSLVFLTDVRGGVWKKLSFETHGRIDPGLAGLAASLPSMLAFEGEKESRFFTWMGIAMAVAGGLTDYKEGSSNRETRLRESRAA
jgi:hypothetical protein